MKRIALIASLCIVSSMASATFELTDPAQFNERWANQKVTIGEDEKYAVEGAGAVSCIQYQADRAADDALHFINLNWVKGFITGINYMRMEENKKAQIGTGLDLDALTLWLDNYCVQHTSAKLSDAAVSLVKELTS